jgi:hypothetical protein
MAKMDLLVELNNLIKAFNESEIDYALYGGLALAVYARPRATLDIDIMVEPNSLDKIKKKVIVQDKNNLLKINIKKCNYFESSRIAGFVLS